MNDETRELIEEIKRIKAADVERFLAKKTENVTISPKQLWAVVSTVVGTGIMVLGITRYMIAAEAPWTDDKSKVLPAIEANQQSIKQLYKYHEQDPPYQPKVRGRSGG